MYAHLAGCVHVPQNILYVSTGYPFSILVQRDIYIAPSLPVTLWQFKNLLIKRQILTDVIFQDQGKRTDTVVGLKLQEDKLSALHLSDKYDSWVPLAQPFLLGPTAPAFPLPKRSPEIERLNNSSCLAWQIEMEVGGRFPSSILWEIHPTTCSQPAPAFRAVRFNTKRQVPRTGHKCGEAVQGLAGAETAPGRKRSHSYLARRNVDGMSSAGSKCINNNAKQLCFYWVEEQTQWTWGDKKHLG